MHRQKAKCLLRLNHGCHAIIEKHYNTFVASAQLACGQLPQEAPKNIRDQLIDG